MPLNARSRPGRLFAPLHPLRAYANRATCHPRRPRATRSPVHSALAWANRDMCLLDLERCILRSAEVAIEHASERIAGEVLQASVHRQTVRRRTPGTQRREAPGTLAVGDGHGAVKAAAVGIHDGERV